MPRKLFGKKRPLMYTEQSGPTGRFLPCGSSLGSVRGQSFCRKGNWNKKLRRK